MLKGYVLIVGCCWLVFCLPLAISETINDKKIYFSSCTHAWDTGDSPAFACNLDIFFGELVTCTHYGATYWDTLYS